ncbi:unnamed protein product, partial [Ectocarpus fasciculatus]
SSSSSIGDGKAGTMRGGGYADFAGEGEGEGGLRGQTALLEREVEEEDRGGSLMFSYAVLTTKAAPRLEWLHERMPVILRGAQDAAAWMSCKGQEASKFLQNHTPYSGEDLVWHPVSKQMNTMRYDAEDCSAAIELKKPAKPLPAITTFFKKKEPPEKQQQQQQQLASPGRTGGGGGGGGSNESCGGTPKRRYVDISGEDATPPPGKAVAAGVSSSVLSTALPPATTASGAAATATTAKRLRMGAGDSEIEGVWRGRGVGVASAAPLSPEASSSPGPPAAGSGKKKPRTAAGTAAAGSPSPRKGSSKAAGAAAAAAAARDRRQSKLTAFFGTPSK